MTEVKKEFNKLKEKKLKTEKKEVKSKKNQKILTRNYLLSKYEFRYNTIHNDTEYRPLGTDEWIFFSDRTFNCMMDELTDAGINTNEQIFRYVIYGRSSQDYDPIEKYIKGLPIWDGNTDHIENFLKQIYLHDEEQRQYFIKCFKKWFVALVGSLIEPHVVNQTCFVLVGSQGRFKTTFLNSLVPEHLRLDYLYSSTFDTHNKDHEMKLGTCILINLDEMSSFNRNDIESIKSRITQDRIQLRKSYGKADTRWWRRASFCGSINKEEFLNDQTGSRRFLPFKIDDIVLDREFDIDLIYSQAYKLFKDGFKFWFEYGDIAEVEKNNERFQDIPMEEELILMHYDLPTEQEIRLKLGVQFLTTSEIAMKFASTYNKINVNNSYKKLLGASLRKLGFSKRNYRLNKHSNPVPLWAVKPVESKNIQEVNAEGSMVMDENEPPI